MKKAISLIVIIFTLFSCGPHRMKCGPKGICDSQTKIESHNKNS